LIDRVRSLDDAEMARFFSLAPQIPGWQREYVRSFDLVISYLYDPFGTLRENLLAAGARQVISGCPRVSGIHAADYLMKPLESLAIYPESSACPRLKLDEPSLADGRRRANSLGNRLVALHAGSGGRRKNWPLECYLDLAGRLVESHGLTPVFTAGEADCELVGRLKRSGAEWTIVEGLSLLEMAGLLSGCVAYAGNDSGITHRAAALGLPVGCIVGPTDPDLWGPRGQSVRIVHEPAGDGSRPGAAAVQVYGEMAGLLEGTRLNR
jgi:hypothetical protein